MCISENQMAPKLKSLNNISKSKYGIWVFYRYSIAINLKNSMI